MDNKEKKIFIYDDLHPEDCAMLQALYSRSPASVEDHIEKVKDAGSGRFMERYYVGYGHASIGDCGTTTIFMENYSMLAAKAIQDNPLYSGQEASTRYLDFSEQPIIDPYNHPYTTGIQTKWMDIYNSWMPKVVAAIQARHPYVPEDYGTERMWENATKARAFDIMRGLLPIGATTLFSWSTNLRQARDKLMHLSQHPLEEVRQLAKDVFAQLKEKYPNSFNGEEVNSASSHYGKRLDYYRLHATKDHYVTPHELLRSGRLSHDEFNQIRKGEMVCHDKLLDAESLNKNESQMLVARPKGAALSRRLESYGNYNLYFMMDFGSFRDLQRHRNGICQVPLIDGQFEMYPWYLEQLEDLLSAEDFKTLDKEIYKTLADIALVGRQEGIKADALKSQYLYPMGVSVMCHLSYTLPQMVYVGELRSSQTVHSTLRPIAQKMLKIVEEKHPGITLYGDMEPDTWSAKRGNQTIEEKAVG